MFGIVLVVAEPLLDPSKAEEHPPDPKPLVDEPVASAAAVAKFVAVVPIPRTLLQP
jgi:hypothetical protein